MKALLLLLWVACISTGSGVSTSTISRSTFPTDSTTNRFPTFSPTYSYYYMDQSSTCQSYSTKYFDSSQDAAYVMAWSSGSHIHVPASSSCSITFSHYSDNNMQFSIGAFRDHFHNYISDCSVKLNIYFKSGAYGSPDRTFTCYGLSGSSYSQSYSSNYITVELINPKRVNSFDFKVKISSAIYHHSEIGLVLGLVFGIGFFLFFAVCLIACCRRRRMRLRRSPPLISTTTTTSNYAPYPTGQAYPPNYGATPAPSSYPGGYQPASYPPPAGSTNYQQQPPNQQMPPPPVYEEKSGPGQPYQPQPYGGAPPPPPYGNAQ